MRDSDCNCSGPPHAIHGKYKTETYAQLLVPAVTFIIVIATISVLLILLLQICKRNQMKMQNLLHLQPFRFFVGQVPQATISSNAVVP